MPYVDDNGSAAGVKNRLAVWLKEVGPFGACDLKRPSSTQKWPLM